MPPSSAPWIPSIPLLQQMQARYGERVEINYLEQGEAGVMIDFVVKSA